MGIIIICLRRGLKVVRLSYELCYFLQEFKLTWIYWSDCILLDKSIYSKLKMEVQDEMYLEEMDGVDHDAATQGIYSLWMKMVFS